MCILIILYSGYNNVIHQTAGGVITKSDHLSDVGVLEEDGPQRDAWLLIYMNLSLLFWLI